MATSHLRGEEWFKRHVRVTEALKKLRVREGTIVLSQEKLKVKSLNDDEDILQYFYEDDVLSSILPAESVWVGEKNNLQFSCEIDIETASRRKKKRDLIFINHYVKVLLDPVHPKRGLYRFENGMLDLKRGYFASFKDYHVDRQICAEKAFPMTFGNTSTAAFDNFLRSQGVPDSLVIILYKFIGNMIFGTRRGWVMKLFLFGGAGNEKSALATFLTTLLAEENVARIQASTMSFYRQSILHHSKERMKNLVLCDYGTTNLGYPTSDVELYNRNLSNFLLRSEEWCFNQGQTIPEKSGYVHLKNACTTMCINVHNFYGVEKTLWKRSIRNSLQLMFDKASGMSHESLLFGLVQETPGILFRAAKLHWEEERMGNRRMHDLMDSEALAYMRMITERNFTE